MEVAKLFGARVKEYRLARGLSQERLADLVGLHRTYTASVERGERNVSLENICRIAGGLGCEPRDLLEGIPSLPAKDLPTANR